MYKDYRYINAGENEIYRYGKKAQAKVKALMVPNDKGFYSIPTDGEKYWTIGTSEGKFGTFAKIGGTCFSVNSWGFAYAKAGTDKGEAFVKAMQMMLDSMVELNEERIKRAEADEDED